MKGSTVPLAKFNIAPILLCFHASTMGSTRVPSSSSGTGAGSDGGFSGGNGGGGGGSSGSW